MRLFDEASTSNVETSGGTLQYLYDSPGIGALSTCDISMRHDHKPFLELKNKLSNSDPIQRSTSISKGQVEKLRKNNYD